MSEMET